MKNNFEKKQNLPGSNPQRILSCENNQNYNLLIGPSKEPIVHISFYCILCENQMLHSAHQSITILKS